MRVRAFRRTPVPAGRVWDVLVDHEGMSSWSPGVTVTLERPGVPEPGGVGAVRRVRGPGVTIREEVTDYELGKRLAYRALSGIPLRDYAGEVILADNGDHTGVTWILSSATTFPVARFVLRFLAGMFLHAMLRAATRRHATRK
jgi:uncharacterized protein YndB with AHSA1/START domain